MNSVSDNDWKQTVGFPINYDSEQSSDDDFDTSDVVIRRHGPRSSMHLLEDGGDGAPADLLGTTPPRARIRNKEKRKTVLMDSDTSLQRVFKDNRRNTVDNFYALERSPDPQGERVKKRASLKLTRTRERDWKQEEDFRADSLPSANQQAVMPTFVESCSRFMSLTSRLKCRGAPAEGALPEPPGDRGLPPCRVNFHKTFSLLINMGGGDKGAKRTISREEQVWQNELKDLIWLELQAKIAGRSLAQQDSFLCAQRGIVPAVVRNITEYRFINDSACRNRTRASDDCTDSKHTDEHDCLISTNDVEIIGCLSFECMNCSDAVGKALKEVGTLLDSFYNAVSLYPSSKAMTVEHPLVATMLFKHRLKAMCLWYNIALHMRMKMLAVRKLTGAMLDKNSRRAPAHCAGTEDCSQPRAPCLVRFNISDNPSDSSNSEGSQCEGKEPTRDELDNVVNDKGDGFADDSTPATPSTQHPPDTPDTADTRDTADTPDTADTRDTPSSTADTTESGYASDASRSLPDNVYSLGSLEELISLSLLSRSRVSPYRHYLSEILKTQGVRRSMMFIQKLRKYILQKVYLTLEKPSESHSQLYESDDRPEMFEDSGEKDECAQDEDVKNAYELRRYGCWSPESLAMKLPSYRSHFLLLSTVSMEVVHDYLALRLETRPEKPSCLTIKQMIQELKEGIDIATDIRAVYVQNIEAALAGWTANDDDKQRLLQVIRTFDATVEDVVTQYLSYLTTMSSGKFFSRATLQAEWSFTARLARRLRCVALRAPHSFTEIVCNQIDRLLRQFEDKFDEFSKRKEDYPTVDDKESKRHFVYSLCREAHSIYASDREMALQTVHFARQLCDRLAAGGGGGGGGGAGGGGYHSYRQKIFSKLMSIRECIVSQIAVIEERSAEATADMSSDAYDNINARLRELLLQVYRLGFELHKELYKFTDEGIRMRPQVARQRPSSLQPSRPETSHLRRRRPETVLIHESFNPMLHRELHKFASESNPDPSVKPVASPPRRPRMMRLDSTADDIEDRLFDDIAGQKQSSIERLLSNLHSAPADPPADPADPLDPLVPGSQGGEASWREAVSRAIIQFAHCWMRFVTSRCDRGRGLRPRWASQGLEFLMLACDPYNTRHLTDSEFEQLKCEMDRCISHVIGSRPALQAEPQASPAPHRHRHHRIHSPQSTSSAGSLGGREVPTPPTPPTEPEPVLDFHGIETRAHSLRVYDAINLVEEARDNKLRTLKFVGRVLESTVSSYEPKLRQVTFKWQRGLKIGSGTFGKVYTVINSSTGQLLALKELSLGAGDRRALRRAANELQVLQGVTHPHLVRYYGCELHREEMLIFMELCVEGCLEALIATSGPLPELTTRRYTKQLVSAVLELHNRNIAHRDIKSGNIFLTNEGHCLKLGDFGCAVKIRANTTAVGELQGTVGTQAYMAPEVFMKSSGHGRAADIWSLGCVVTEMASGKRPFSEYDSNYQIMFVVGMGGRPNIPDSLSEEGRQFCMRCLTHEPEQRPKAHELAAHHFLMVKADEDCKCEPGFLITKM